MVRNLFPLVGSRRTDAGAHVPAHHAARIALGDVIEIGFVLLFVGVLLVNHVEFVGARLVQQAGGVDDSGKGRGSPTCPTDGAPAPVWANVYGRAAEVRSNVGNSPLASD